MPNITYIQRKPKDLGTEMKCVACGMTGVLLFLEIQRGKEGMRDAEFTSDMMKTAACTNRLIKYTSLPLPVDDDSEVSSDDDADNGEQEDEDTLLKMAAKTYLGDAWFGSVPSVVHAAMQGANLICVIKAGHAGYPRKFFEAEMADWPPGSNLVAQTTVEGVDLVAVGYKYTRRKVLCFLFKKGAASIRDGNPYIAKWKNNQNNTISRFVPRPQAISTYFADCNKVDVHNQSRQSDLRLEKCWVTRCGFFHIATTLFGITVVDAWKTYRHHLNYRHRHFQIDLISFVSILAKDLLFNSLTRRTNLPPAAFNLGMVGYEIAVPAQNQIAVPGPDQDPEIPAAERHTQESVYPIPGEDPILDYALNEAMPARSVEMGDHGLKRVEEFVAENINYNDGHGNLCVRSTNRRKRGRCVACNRKTLYYCPLCSNKEGRNGRYWVCGPDAPHGRICQAKHDSDWVFDLPEDG